MTVGDLAQALLQYDQDQEVVSSENGGTDRLIVAEFCVKPIIGNPGDDGLFHESADGRKYLYIG